MTSEYLKRLDVQGHLKVQEALRKWDPIGVISDPSKPDDEYDMYAGPIIAMLDAGMPRAKLVDYLEEICTSRIEVAFDRRHAETIVDELIEFWPLWKAKLRDLGPHFIVE